MAPLYGVDALLCLTLDGVSPTLNVIRDCYEAFTLYSFTKMLYVWLGGEVRRPAWRTQSQAIDAYQTRPRSFKRDLRFKCIA